MSKCRADKLQVGMKIKFEYGEPGNVIQSIVIGTREYDSKRTVVIFKLGRYSSDMVVYNDQEIEVIE